MENTAVSVQALSKCFKLPNPNRPRTLQESFVRGFRGLTHIREFWALKDISFNVNRGMMTGIIGHNGAGKSTLLRLIGGVGLPTSGSCQTVGRLGALIDLGAGFHPDLTGVENIFINGVISGLTRREIKLRFDNIVAFAGLESYINNPLRTYSTGMQLRLAFAIAIRTDPDVLLIDEVLAVGDLVFQQKCLERIASLKNEGCAILLVSHDMTLVSKLCNQAIWLNGGKLAAQGPAELVTKEYIRAMGAGSTQLGLKPLEMEGQLPENKNRFGSHEMEITSVQVLDTSGKPVHQINSGQGLNILIAYAAPREVHDPIFGITITRAEGLICYDTSTLNAGLSFPTLVGQGSVVLELDRLDLAGGNYFIDVGVYRSDWSYAYDYHWQAYPLVVNDLTNEKGILSPPRRWKIVSK